MQFQPITALPDREKEENKIGYTHYFRTSKNGIPVAAWEKICADVKTLLTNLPATAHKGPLAIAFEEDEPHKAPEVSDAAIRFNGVGQNGHETFLLERLPTPSEHGFDDKAGTVFAFCKTEYKPYDLVVCAVLIVAAKHAASSLGISSDGDLDDWKPAFDWTVSVLGPEYAAAAVASRLLGGRVELGMLNEEVEA